MSFLLYDLSFLIVFCLAVATFLIIKRKKVVRDGLLFLYKTSIGLKLIDTLGRKYPKTLKVLSYISIACGYVLMILSVYFLIQIISVFTNPVLVKMIKVPPIMPLIPYLDRIFSVTWMPPFYFTYWIIAIALVAIFHEGFHGIFARFANIRIKSTGFGFLGPFLAFFVEQDDKQMKKAKIFSQLSVLSSGVFANILLSIIFFILMIGFFSMTYAPVGAIFNDYSYSVVPVSAIMGGIGLNMTVLNQTLNVDGLNLTKVKFGNHSYFISDAFFDVKDNLTSDMLVKLYHDEPAINSGLMGAITTIDDISVSNNLDVSRILADKKPGEKITVTTLDMTNESLPQLNYEFKLGEDYSNSSRAVMGIATVKTAQSANTLKAFLYRLFNSFRDPNVFYQPIANPELTIFLYNLLWWVFMINVSVAIANMIPLGIFDGGRFFYLTILGITRKEKVAAWTFKIMTWIILAILAIMMGYYFIGIF